MKKKIITSLVALAALVALPAAAQKAATGSDATAQQKEQCQKKEGKKCDKVQGKKEARRQHQRVEAFAGINLTDSQKVALKALRPERRQKDFKKIEGVKNDSIKFRPDGRKMRADYVKGVKGILTPEQYVVFLENIVIKDASIPGGSHKGHGEMRKGHGQKDGKGKPGQRPAKPQKEAKQ